MVVLRCCYCRAIPHNSTKVGQESQAHPPARPATGNLLVALGRLLVLPITCRANSICSDVRIVCTITDWPSTRPSFSYLSFVGNRGVGNLRFIGLVGLVGLGPASRAFTFHLLDSLLTATTKISPYDLVFQQAFDKSESHLANSNTHNARHVNNSGGQGLKKGETLSLEHTHPSQLLLRLLVSSVVLFVPRTAHCSILVCGHGCRSHAGTPCFKEPCEESLDYSDCFGRYFPSAYSGLLGAPVCV
jgi:hypothetical protein